MPQTWSPFLSSIVTRSSIWNKRLWVQLWALDWSFISWSGQNFSDSFRGLYRPKNPHYSPEKDFIWCFAVIHNVTVRNEVVGHKRLIQSKRISKFWWNEPSSWLGHCIGVTIGADRRWTMLNRPQKVTILVETNCRPLSLTMVLGGPIGRKVERVFHNWISTDGFQPLSIQIFCAAINSDQKNVSFDRLNMFHMNSIPSSRRKSEPSP